MPGEASGWGRQGGEREGTPTEGLMETRIWRSRSFKPDKSLEFQYQTFFMRLSRERGKLLSTCPVESHELA